MVVAVEGQHVDDEHFTSDRFTSGQSISAVVAWRSSGGALEHRTRMAYGSLIEAWSPIVPSGRAVGCVFLQQLGSLVFQVEGRQVAGCGLVNKAHEYLKSKL